jgi:ribosomal protein S18 acetylase RimI-like enzyme
LQKAKGAGVIRDLTLADLPALEALFRAAADYMALETGAAVDGSQARTVFTDAPPGVDPATNLRLGLFEGDRLIGKVDTAFGYPEPKDGYIGLMLLDPKARRAGHGTRLLRVVEDRARARGARRLLVAVLVENAAGRAFWARSGFVPERLFKDKEYGARQHDVQRMVKLL